MEPQESSRGQLPPAPRPARVLRLLAWPVVMTWHLWRILTLRPYFVGLPDNRAVVVSFTTLYFAAGLARWTWDEGHAPGPVLLRLAFNLITLMFFFERTGRSSAMVAVALGTSVAWDMVAIAISLVGGSSPDPNTRLLLSAGEIAAVGVCYWRFIREPRDVQASGYKPSVSTTKIFSDKTP